MQIRKASKKFIVGSILALCAAVITGGYVLLSQRDQNHEPSTNKPEKTSVPTRTQQTEGQDIKVPESVDPSSIKNYELITENGQFKIRKLNDSYTITIYAIINRPSDSASYHQQLRDYKKAALQYLTDHGVDVNKVNIIYDPPEAANY